MERRAKKYLSILIVVALATTSGTTFAQPAEIEVEAETDASPTEASPPSANDDSAVDETIVRLEARIAALEAEAQVEARAHVETSSEVVTYEDAEDFASEPAPDESWWDRLDLRIGGYIQTQLVTSQLSHDELGPDGTPLNQDRFVIRRGRLRIDRVWDYASVGFEIDASTTRGPFVGIRRAEISFFLPDLTHDDAAVPLVAATVGLTSTPFGFELRQGNRERWFLERSTGSLAFQRGEPDIGVRLWGGVGILRYDLAIQNGNPLDDRAGGEPVDLTAAKDFVGRVGIETNPSSSFELAAGVSFHTGTGLHRGSAATKPHLIWVDIDEDGTFDGAVETTTTAGQAATPSETFHRWGWNADLQIGFHSPIGWTRLYGEATVATNLDRSLYVADPVANGADVREFAWYAAILQEVTEYAIVGFRVDSYDPNADWLDTRRGRTVARDATILTYSPMVGAQLPGRGRLVFQYDRVRDQLGRDASGVPTDLANDQFVFRLQMEF